MEYRVGGRIGGLDGPSDGAEIDPIGVSSWR